MKNEAQLCPVCGGTGQWHTGSYSLTALNYRACHGCNGAGWVIVPQPNEFVDRQIRTKAKGVLEEK